MVKTQTDEMKGVKSIDELIRQTTEGYQFADNALNKGNFSAALAGINYNRPEQLEKDNDQLMYGMLAIKLSEYFGLGVDDDNYGRGPDADEAYASAMNAGLKSPLAKQYASALVQEYAIKAGLAPGPELPSSYGQKPAPSASYQK